ncbi:D-glycero-beta-D-manno-heptose-1,7-bisphosphate 7-phosphatase [Desulfonema limicola]|uniref:D,D-heptose 1,7-bisphosphate phosphatase n=1 Tax=Desulfonema limicola TaxID=45656 RepID=A0A975B4J6_9BACT|nr:D-glycero-beta-D-manno-heptose 1,7-bisphosphate 7-phosphatase [Desulfonema limicola]QTA78652.1 D-glycero-beta-D-manno-heptose-1,7-bisphosphate 7-phosphatase [Desulfonema limicola]
MNKLIKRTVFLDRDGVINQDSPYYIKDINEFKFIPGSIDAVRKLTENRFFIIIITNQSAVNRGLIDLKKLAEIHEFMLTALSKQGGIIKDIFFCPHHPSQECRCRKPLPGMILKAVQKYNIDLMSSYMIGDSAKDIECAVNAGCGNNILVKTGNYAEALKSLSKKGINPGYTAPNLDQAADYIIKRLDY